MACYVHCQHPTLLPLKPSPPPPLPSRPHAGLCPCPSAEGSAARVVLAAATGGQAVANGILLLLPSRSHVSANDLAGFGSQVPPVALTVV